MKVEHFLPRLEDARAAGAPIHARVWWRLGGEVNLLDKEPFEVRKVAAIVVEAKALKRDIREQEMEVSVAQAAAVPEPMPPAPDDFVAAEHLLFVERRGGASDCSNCSHGRVVCGLCGGFGQLAISQGTSRSAGLCGRCGGSGQLSCDVCTGTGRSVVVQARRVSDVAARLRYPYVPEMPFALEEALTSYFEREAASPEPLPDCLRVDLSPRRTGGPYRQHFSDPTSFSGFEFGDTLAVARQAIRGLAGTGQLLLEEVSCWARPVLWVTYRAFSVWREVGLFVQADGALRAVVTDGGV